MEFKPLYYEDKLEIINPEGYAGLVTLWSKPDKIKEKISSSYPELFKKDSPLVTLTSLYGNGLPQMLANLANNPQVERIAITGTDTNTVKSSEYLINFLTKGVETVQVGGISMSRVKGTSLSLDPQLNPEIYKHIEFKKFEINNLEALVNFVKNPKRTNPQETDRISIKLAMPEFKDYPSDIFFHNVIAETPLKAWTEVLYLIDRFGQDIELEKGKRRALYNLDVNIQKPDFEQEEELRKFSFNPEELKEYQIDFLNPELPIDISYKYGNRLRAYWGGDAIIQIGKMFKEDTLNRHCFISLWDTKQDLFDGESSPCFTDAYFVNNQGKLSMTASFRTHNAVSAYLTNIYGLRAVQEKVAQEADIQTGQINIRSRWIGIDPDNAKTISALEQVKRHRKISLDVNDPRGYLIIDTKDGVITAEHHNSEGILLKTYEGSKAKEIKDQLRHDSTILNPDHAMWIGYELARAHYKIHKELPEL